MISTLRNLIIGNHVILLTASWIYNLLHFSLIRNSMQKGVCFKGSFLNHVRIKTSGKNNKVVIGEKTIMNHTTILVSGDNCSLKIEGGGTNISNCLLCVHDGGNIIISTKFTHNGGTISACEGRSVIIGEDCMFAGGVRVSTTDHHSIIDLANGERINKAKDVTVGNHVWLGLNVNVMKGTEIADNIVIGAGSIVAGKIQESNSVYAGSPAKIIKQGITWTRELI